MTSGLTAQGILESLTTALGKRFALAAEKTAARRVVYYDTFDWRLHRDGGFLCVEPGRQRGSKQLSWWRDGGLAHRLPALELGLASDLPAGDLRDDMAPVISMRRLLPIVELKLGGSTLRVLDRRRKTVARLHFEEGTASSEGGDGVELPKILRVTPVRGYDKALRQVTQRLEERMGLRPTASSELERALAAIGRQAGDYTSKVAIVLDPEMSAGAAARHIHRELLAAIERNEAGTLADLDSEFLHDFRVAVRRTRSALTQIKGVFDPADLEHFKQEFKWLGGLTGPTRDLDVYLLKMDDYKQDLPASVGEVLAPLEDFLLRQQLREQRRMARQLRSQRYRTLLSSWDTFLGEEGKGAVHSERPIREVADQRLWKAYRRVVKKGLAIRDETPAAAVHELRIDCKKLRYLLEFFSSLYEADGIRRLIKELKRLQDNLGDFNDYEVQQDSLSRFAEQMHKESQVPAATLMAMGRLVEHLENGQARERRRFSKRFERFVRPENQSLARLLFGPRPSPG